MHHPTPTNNKEYSHENKTPNFQISLESQLSQVVGSRRHTRAHNNSVNHERSLNGSQRPRQSSQRQKKVNRGQRKVVNVTSKSYSLDPQTIDLSLNKNGNLPSLHFPQNELRARSKRRSSRHNREHIQRPRSKPRLRYQGSGQEFSQIKHGQPDQNNQQSSQRSILELIMSNDQEVGGGGERSIARNTFLKDFANFPSSMKKNHRIKAQNLDSQTFFQLLQGPKNHQDLRSSNFEVDLSNVDIEDLKGYLDENFVNFKTSKIDYMLKNASLHTKVGALRKFMLETLNSHQNLLKVSQYFLSITVYLSSNSTIIIF